MRFRTEYQDDATRMNDIDSTSDWTADKDETRRLITACRRI